MRVQFKRGKERNLPSSGEVGTFYYAEDTRKIFEGNGSGKPLSEYTNILFGFKSLADLEKQNPRIKGKVYITNDGDMYMYDGYSYLLLNGERGKDTTTLYELSWQGEHFSSLTKILDLREIFENKQMKSIDRSEIIFKNTSSRSTRNDNKLQVVILDKEIEVLNVIIDAQETQKYLLGISPNIKVFAKGRMNGVLYINYFKLSDEEIGGSGYY